MAEFALEPGAELILLQREFEIGDYRSGDYRLFTIYERKPRVIAAAPFRDRVVHHAVMNSSSRRWTGRLLRIPTLVAAARGSMRRWIVIKPGRRPIGTS